MKTTNQHCLVDTVPYGFYEMLWCVQRMCIFLVSVELVAAFRMDTGVSGRGLQALA